MRSRITMKGFNAGIIVADNEQINLVGITGHGNDKFWATHPDGRRWTNILTLFPKTTITPSNLHLVTETTNPGVVGETNAVFIGSRLKPGTKITFVPHTEDPSNYFVIIGPDLPLVIDVQIGESKDNHKEYDFNVTGFIDTKNGDMVLSLDQLPPQE